MEATVNTQTGSDFEGIDDVDVGGGQRLPKLTAGRYTLEVEALRVVNTRKFGKYFIGEFKVIKAEGPTATPEGTSASYKMQMSKEVALANIKKLMAAITKQPANKINQGVCEEAVADTQPCKGHQVKAEAFDDRTKDGFSYLKFVFTPA